MTAARLKARLPRLLGGRKSPVGRIGPCPPRPFPEERRYGDPLPRGRLAEARGGDQRLALRVKGKDIGHDIDGDGVGERWMHKGEPSHTRPPLQRVARPGGEITDVHLDGHGFPL